MISAFKTLDYRDSGIVYKATMHQIKKLYETNPNLAGELAISAIELCLGEEFSSDDPLIDIALANAVEVVKKNHKKYDNLLESKRQSRIEEQHLDVIAELTNQGMSHEKICEYLRDNFGDKITRQAVTKRVNVIKEDFPELLSCNVENRENMNKCCDDHGMQPMQPMQPVQPHDNVNDSEKEDVNNNLISFTGRSSLEKEGDVNSGKKPEFPELLNLPHDIRKFAMLFYSNSLPVESNESYIAEIIATDVYDVDDEMLVNWYSGESSIPCIDRICADFKRIEPYINAKKKQLNEEAEMKLRGECISDVKKLVDMSVDDELLAQKVDDLHKNYSYRDICDVISSNYNQIERSVSGKTFDNPRQKISYVMKCISNKLAA